MDAYEIALLMANQDAQNPLAMRYGTVQSLNDDGSVSVVPDGQEKAVPAVKCCRPCAGNRVVLLVNGTEWLAVSVMGGECPYEIGDVWTTFSDDSPHDRWPGTTWEQIRDRFLLASGKRSGGSTGGEEEHTLSEAELPKHLHEINLAWGGSAGTGSDYVQYSGGGNVSGWQTWFSGSGNNLHNQAHNNMPPYITAHIWKRIS